MSTDRGKAESGGGDSPVLFGPSNDPRLSGRIDALSEKALESAIARLGAFSDDVFSDDEEDPFLDGSASEVPLAADPDHQPVTADREREGADLDLILDKLSSDVEEEVAEAGETAPEAPSSLRDRFQATEGEQTPIVTPRSPIADVLAGSGHDEEVAEDETGYHDPGVPDADEATDADPEGDEDSHDPFGDMDLYEEYDEDLSEEDASVLDETYEEDLYDPDFPEEDAPQPDLPDTDDAGDDQDGAGPVEGAAAHQIAPSHGLPEPTPYGDPDAMGGAYGYDEEPEPAQEDSWTDPEGAEQDMLEDWQMPEEKVAQNADDPGHEPVDTDWSPRADEEGTGETGSALDDLLTDLGPGPDTEAEPSAPEEAAEGPDAFAYNLRPSFLRRDSEGRPVSGVLRPVTPPEEDHEVSAITDEGGDLLGPNETVDADGAPLDETGEGPEEPSSEPAKRSGRKRMLLGVAALALIAAAAAGVYVMRPDLLGVPRPAEAPTPVQTLAAAKPPTTGLAPPPTAGLAPPPTTDLAPPPNMSFPPEAQENAPPPIDPVELAEAPAPDPVPDLTAADPAVSPEVSDLLAELSREPVAPAPVEVSTDEFEALVALVEEAERARSEAETRASELGNEMTGLTDQITGLLQRDSDHAERLERMERLIRGQSAILAQFGQMEESLEQTQVVLLDVSARIGAVEGQNPADRDAVNRALADVEERIQALTANMSILARMSIEGVDALRAPNASSGTVGVQTAPAAEQAAGGADPVFRSETGGFRISSDPAGRVPAGVAKDDFVEGYGYVLDVLPASDGQRLVIMENGSVLVPSAD